METNNYEAKAKALVGHLSERQYPDYYVSLFKSECERLVSQLVSHIVLRQPFPPMFHDKRQIITNSQEKYRTLVNVSWSANVSNKLITNLMQNNTGTSHEDNNKKYGV